jgi:hypothetical protein
MKIFKIIKNNWIEPDSTFKIYDINHEAESQHKRQKKKRCKILNQPK